MPDKPPPPETTPRPARELGEATAASALRGRLVRYFRPRVRDPSVADDLVQEVFLRVHQRADQLRDEQSLQPWVDRIARNVLIDHHRRRRPQERREERLLDEPIDGEHDGDANENQQISGWLRPMIERLPEPSREVLLLAEIEGLPQAEIAARLGLSLSGAKSRVQRARAKLRDVLQQCCHFELDRRGNVLDWWRRSPKSC